MATGQAQGDKEKLMADSLVQRLEQLIGNWTTREIIAGQFSIEGPITAGHHMAFGQAAAFRECIAQLSEVCRAWQTDQGWRDTLLSEAFDALGHVSAKEWRKLGVDYAKLRLQYERRIPVATPTGREE